GGALAVGILNAQQHLAPTPARVKPVEQSGASPSDMKEAGRRGGKACNNGLSHVARSMWAEIGSAAGPCSTAAHRGVRAIHAWLAQGDLAHSPGTLMIMVP